MWRELRPAIVVLVALTAITGLVYPLAVTGIAQLVFPSQAQGSLIERNGHTVGSALIGQSFTSDKYFHGRPSATTAPDPNDASKTVAAPYNAANSGGSNLAPSNKALIDRVQGDIDKLKQENPTTPVPADLVTTSAGSGPFSGSSSCQSAQLDGKSGSPDRHRSHRRPFYWCFRRSAG
jgi:K+-transporting ATPase ATPase C chain